MGMQGPGGGGALQIKKKAGEVCADCKDHI